MVKSEVTISEVRHTIRLAAESITFLKRLRKLGELLDSDDFEKRLPAVIETAPEAIRAALTPG